MLALVAAGVANLTTSQADSARAREYLTAGQYAHQQGCTDAAREDYRRALAHDPSNKLGCYYLGTIEQQVRDNALAEQDYRAALYFDGSFGPALHNLGVLQHPPQR